MVYAKNKNNNNNNNENETILSNQTQSISQQLLQLTGNTVSETEELMDSWIGKQQWDLTTSAKFNEQVLKPLRNLRIALIVVDYQNDFVDGSLKIGDGDAGQDPHQAIPALNDLITNETWDLVVYTKDWHPPNHISFLSQARNTDRRMAEKDDNRQLQLLDSVRFTSPVDFDQVLYPDHCVQNTWGADIHPDVVVIDNAEFVNKGTDSYMDSYSAFNDNNGQSKTELEDVLHHHNIDAVVVAGLAYDICVRFTCLDAVKLNFLAAVIPDCSAGLMKKGIAEAEELFRANNVSIISSQEAKKIAQGTYLPPQWVRSVAMG